MAPRARLYSNREDGSAAEQPKAGNVHSSISFTSVRAGDQQTGQIRKREEKVLVRPEVAVLHLFRVTGTSLDFFSEIIVRKETIPHLTSLILKS